MSDDGRGALVGEFLLSFFNSSKDMQDQIIFAAVKHHLSEDRKKLIDPYPVLSHLDKLIKAQKKQG